MNPAEQVAAQMGPAALLASLEEAAGTFLALAARPAPPPDLAVAFTALLRHLVVGLRWEASFPQLPAACRRILAADPFAAGSPVLGDVLGVHALVVEGALAHARRLAVYPNMRPDAAPLPRYLAARSAALAHEQACREALNPLAGLRATRLATVRNRVRMDKLAAATAATGAPAVAAWRAHLAGDPSAPLPAGLGRLCWVWFTATPQLLGVNPLWLPVCLATGVAQVAGPPGDTRVVLVPHVVAGQLASTGVWPAVVLGPAQAGDPPAPMMARGLAALTADASIGQLRADPAAPLRLARAALAEPLVAAPAPAGTVAVPSS